MDIATFTDFRQNLKTYLDQVFSKHTPLAVKRTNGEDVIVISKADYDSMMETFYLLKSPRNAQRILQGLNEFENGQGTERKLIEE